MDRKSFKDYAALAAGGLIGWAVTHFVWTRWDDIKSAVSALFGA